MSINFEEYESKPITRLAYRVKDRDLVRKVGEATFCLSSDSGEILFKAYEPVIPGDYIVYLNESDIYHCSAIVFKERNIVKE